MHLSQTPLHMELSCLVRLRAESNSRCRLVLADVKKRYTCMRAWPLRAARYRPVDAIHQGHRSQDVEPVRKDGVCIA